MEHFGSIMFGEAARCHQARRGSLDRYDAMKASQPPVGLGPDEREFLATRDSFYLASVGHDGWPYVQHRGGPAGFIRVVDDHRIAWVERPGNQQFVTGGHLDEDGRIAIIAMDYPNRVRLKLLGRATFDPSPTADQLIALGFDGRAEAVVSVDVVAFDWNCPKYITPRYTEQQMRATIEPLAARIAELEAALAATGAGTTLTPGG